MCEQNQFSSLDGPTRGEALVESVSLFREVSNRSSEEELDDYRGEVARALRKLRYDIEDAVSELRQALDDTDSSEVDCAIEALDETLTSALAKFRRDTGAY